MIDAGIAQVRDEVGPALAELDGFVGLSMMVDRESGMCIATSSWHDESAMRASESQVLVVRNRAAEVLGGSPVVEEWEVALMHRGHSTHEGACVRSAWLQTDVDHLDQVIEVFRTFALPQIEEMDGFCSASFMVDRKTGRTVSSSCFDSRTAMEASRDRADRVRTDGSRQANASVLEVREFDLVLAHLRVPEMV